MRRYKYDRGRKLIITDKIQFINETEKAIYFRVNEFEVTFEQVAREGRNSIERLHCTCRYHTSQGVVNEALCSHLIACIGYLIGCRGKREKNY